MNEPLVSRRIVFTGLGALGVAAALAGCGGDGGTSSSPGQQTITVAPKGEVLASTADIPVGGGVVLTDKKIVITQPKAGEYEAFSALCKHQGFPVGKVEDGTITCLKHNSTYDAATGERTGGPAPEGAALNRVEITVEGDEIRAA